ncbi:MAG: hypothetical protein A2550_06120 [Candidatus Jacksonbacteria bacterium RIFOXYD2_FULL_43_21]|nr:MAG: hypothetical protein A2550_06120 [Candidatus Jacksonbacteria bacterium RIFOXYD2_FULL_43_21]
MIAVGAVFILNKINNSSSDQIDYPPLWACGDSIEYGGQSYATVYIGTQCWFAENLNIGAKIAGAVDQTNNGIIEKYCYLNKDSYCDEGGGLYQWDEAMAYSTTPGAQGLCPSGWHIPTHDEYTTLERAVCVNKINSKIIDKYCFEIDSNCSADDGRHRWIVASAYNSYPECLCPSGWHIPTHDEYTALCALSFPYTYGDNSIGTGGGGTDEGFKLKLGGGSGFNALLPGVRGTNGPFGGMHASFWSSSERGTSAWIRSLDEGGYTVARRREDKLYGVSVRCLKD